MKYEEEFNINELVDKRIIELTNKLVKFAHMLEKYPDGKLLVAPGSTSNSYRYYNRQSPKDKQGVYLDKNQQKLKKQLAEKKYIEKLIKNIKIEIKELERIRKINLNDSIIRSYTELTPGIQKIITPYNIDTETLINIWQNELYEGLGFDESDSSEHFSEKGERMRSKSELLIANALFSKGIPYKYECPVTLANGRIVYPDFTILNVKQRKVKYWEHLGKMGDMTYVERNIWKLDEYKKTGIYLGINLFITYEYGQRQLGTSEINKVIDAIIN